LREAKRFSADSLQFSVEAKGFSAESMRLAWSQKIFRCVPAILHGAKRFFAAFLQLCMEPKKIPPSSCDSREAKRFSAAFLQTNAI
jgi:hypothetical protein